MEGNDQLEALLSEIVGSSEKAAALAQELGIQAPGASETHKQD